MKIVQYDVVLLFCKFKKKKCLYFSNFRGKNTFCNVWKNDFMLFVQLVLMT